MAEVGGCVASVGSILITNLIVSLGLGGDFMCLTCQMVSCGEYDVFASKTTTFYAEQCAGRQPFLVFLHLVQ